MAGAFLTSRDIFTSSIWENPVEFRLFFFIYGNAVFSEEGVQQGNVLVKRGQFLRSYRNLQKDLQYIEKRAVKQYPLSRIKRAIDRLVKEKRLKIEDTEVGTLFTVVNYHLYQGFENYKNIQMKQQRNSNGTATEQQRNNNNKDIKDIKDNNDINNINNNNIINKRHVFNDKQMKLAELLWKYVQQNNPSMKNPSLAAWANTIRLMMERDKREGKQIQEVILWATQDSFWHKNILSADKLRKQFDRLVIQMNEKPSDKPFKKPIRQELIPDWLQKTETQENQETEQREKEVSFEEKKRMFEERKKRMKEYQG